MEDKLLFNIGCLFTTLLCVAVLSACGAAPVSVDQYQISISQETASLNGGGLGISQSAPGLYRVSGAAGSVSSGALVRIVNSRTMVIVHVTANTDGSFATVIEAKTGDELVFNIILGNTMSDPTYIYVGALNIKNPYPQIGNWYVGQVHAHTNWSSDGITSPQQLEAAYYDAGYHFVISTDHQIIHSSDFHMPPDPDNSLTGKNLLWIGGAELSYPEVHIGAWGATVPPTAGIPSIQQRIDYIRASGGLVAMNHPNTDTPTYAWDWHREVLTNTGYSFVEAFNALGSRTKDGLRDISHKITAVNLADEFNQVWWLGVDDNHDIRDSSSFDQYAVVVQTDSPTISQKDILGAADAGNFYIRESALGPVLVSVNVKGNDVIITMAGDMSNYNFIWKKRGDEIVQSNLNIKTTASYRVTGNEGYIRAEIERIRDGKRIYTQPLFIANNVNLVSSVTVSGGIGAAKLIDNKESTHWESSELPAWFIVDVGRVRQVNAIRIDWWGQSDPRRFNYKVEVSETGAFNGEHREVVRKTFDNRSRNTLDFFDAMTRYIKVTATSQSVGSGNPVRISEVRVFDSSPDRTQLYLDNVNGDDFNSGLSGRPWKSFAHAREMVRPRDTLNFMNTGAPYTGQMVLDTMHGGKHEDAIIIFQGDPVTLTEIDATGMLAGFKLHSPKYIELRYFDIYSASTANIMMYEDPPEKTTALNIRYNRLHHGLGRGFQGSGDFTLAHNLIYGNAMEGAFVYLDNSQAKIFNNIFYNNHIGLAFQDFPNISAQVMNNISSGNILAAFSRGASGTITSAHNCVDGIYLVAHSTTGGWGTSTDIQSDPLFMDPRRFDFRLQPSSPCIDAGIDLDISRDFVGLAPYDAPFAPNRGSVGAYSKDFIDIGAFEHH